MRKPITKEQILYEILPQAKLIYSAKKQISGCLEPRGEMRIDCTRTPVIFLGNNIVCCGLPTSQRPNLQIQEDWETGFNICTLGGHKHPAQNTT